MKPHGKPKKRPPSLLEMALRPIKQREKSGKQILKDKSKLVNPTRHKL